MIADHHLYDEPPLVLRRDCPSRTNASSRRHAVRWPRLRSDHCLAGRGEPAAAWPASPAQAHDELTSSTPSAGARLAAAPRQVRLVFSERVEPGFTTMALKVAEGPTMALTAREDG